MYNLSPSRIARFFYHDCHRYLRYHATPRDRREDEGVPNPPFDHSPVTRAILEGGYAWEERVIARLGARVHIAPAAARRTPVRDRTFDDRATLEHLRALKPGEALYQGTLVAPDSFYAAYGLDRERLRFAPCRPDLAMLTTSSAGPPRLRVIDVKASDALKTSHRVQVTLYGLILRHVLQSASIALPVDDELGAVWLYGSAEPETFDLRAMREHLERFLREDLTRILDQEASAADWHLTFRCEWCEFFDLCRDESERTQSVSQVPYLSTPARNHLRRLGVDSLEQFATLLDQPGADGQLAPCASLAGKRERLGRTVRALRAGAVQVLGGASLAMPKGENVRLLLTLQREPVSGRTYAAALLRTGSDDAFPSGARHEEQFVASTPEACDELRRHFVRRLHAILQDLDAHNAGRPWAEQRSLQTYVFDSYEADILRSLLVESLADPAAAAAALDLFFHFHAEELLEAEEHPVVEAGFPIVILTDVVRSLLAVPVPVAYQLADLSRALPAPGDRPFQYSRNDYFSFRLSNALRSDAIHAAWAGRAGEHVGRIEQELRIRLFATRALVDGIRAAAVDPDSGQSLLFSWPPKFALPGREVFREPVLSRLAFIARYEGVMTYLEQRAARTAPVSERLAGGTVLRLRALSGTRFAAQPAETVADMESGGFPDRLLTEDSAEGERAQMAFPDYAYRRASWVPKNRPVLYAGVTAIEPQPGGGPPTVTLRLTTGESSPAVRLDGRYLLHPRHVDFNTDRVVDRLREIDGASDPWPAELLRDPLAWHRELAVPGELAGRAGRLADEAGFTRSQRDAFGHALNRNLTLVWGPPGTGKTHFLALAILTLLEAHRRAGRPFRVLVSAFTHAAIENCLAKTVRLGRTAPVAFPVTKVGEVRTPGADDVPAVSPEDARGHADDNPQCVLGATAYATLRMFRGHPEAAPFDLVVIDEASQLRVPEALLPISRLAAGGRLLVAGDDRQLPPIIKGAYPNPRPGEPVLHRSVFEALRTPDLGRAELTCQLLENFRMNEGLCRFPAARVYGPAYRSADASVAGRRIALAPARTARTPHAWVERALDPDFPWVMCVIEGVQAAAENAVEADLVAEVVTELRHRLHDPAAGAPFGPGEAADAAFWRDGLFIVSPHHAQIRAVRRALAQRGLRKPFVDTVDKMQGRECEAVVVSYGVADQEFAAMEGEFIYSLNRLNVAITRARSKCVVFLPRPLLTPTLQALEQDEAMEGIAYMLGLERHVSGGERDEFALRGGSGRLVLLRTR